MNRKAFTLIELLVVIVIIAVLVSVGLLVGTKISGSGKIKATENTIQILDQAMTAYLSANGNKMPAFFKDVNGRSFPLIDASAGATTANPVESSATLAMVIIEGEPSAAQILKNVPAQFATRGTLATGTYANTGAGTSAQIRRRGEAVPAEGLIVRDAWNNPIRFVHPAYHGVYTNRSIEVPGDSNQNFTRRVTSGTVVGNADGGQCSTSTPYFYSAGPDGNPSTREDNVYSKVPNFPTEVLNTP
jgi:prepilin-type N-terminal cleavage/methylation domain-containing protein